ncbi:hypothetical protein Hanom_Chr05g00416071 [Helianthus anomalus]
MILSKLHIIRFLKCQGVTTITTALIFFISVLFGLIADATGTVAFYIAGTGGDDDTIMSTAVRFPAQIR